MKSSKLISSNLYQAWALLFCLSAPMTGFAQDEKINTEIKQTYINSQIQEDKVTRGSAPENDEVLVGNPREQIRTPFKVTDPTITNITPLDLGEQPGAIERPTGAIKKPVDPSRAIEERSAEHERYLREREKYRREIQAEFVKRARSEGVNTNRNIAEEIRKLETDQN